MTRLRVTRQTLDGDNSGDGYGDGDGDGYNGYGDGA